jgi:hypothetical protein
MTNLIIAIIAISLTVLILIVSAPFLGEAIVNNGTKAESMKLRNDSQQIAGAISIYKNDGNVIDQSFDLKDLKDKYITSIPKGNWKAEPFYIFTSTTSETCIEANRASNFRFSTTDSNVYIDPRQPSTPIPYCSKDNLSVNIPCCYTP